MSNINAEEYLQQGIVLMSKKQYDSAIEYLTKSVEADNMNPQTYITLGTAYANVDRYEEAGESFEKAQKLAPKDGIIDFHIGNIAFLKGDRNKGMVCYNTAISKGYDNAQIYFNLGLMFEEDDNEVQAMRNYSKASLKDPLRADVRIRKIKLLINNNKNAEALRALDEMIFMCPDVFEGYHMKFMLLSNMKAYDKALETINLAKSLFPSDLGFVYDQAVLLTNMGRYDESYAILKTLEDKKDENISLYRVFMAEARIFAAKADMDTTIACLKKAVGSVDDLEKSSEAKEGLFFLMNCYMNTQQFENAMECAIKIKNGNGNDYYTNTAYYYEPLCLKRMGKEKEAENMFAAAVRWLREFSLQNPGNVDCYVLRILCLRELKEYEKALELIDYIEKIGTESLEVHSIKASLLKNLGRDAEAAKEMEIVNKSQRFVAVFEENK